MASEVESLAVEIAALETDEQQALWEQVAELNRSTEEILAESGQVREKIVPYVTYSQVRELVTRLPLKKLPLAYQVLVDLSVSDADASSFQQGFMLLPLTERRRLMAEQAKQMMAHYEQTASERQAWQAGDFIDINRVRGLAPNQHC